MTFASGTGENQLARMVSSFELTRNKHDSLEEQGTHYFGTKLIKRMNMEKKDYVAGIATAKTTGFQIVELTFENITTGSAFNCSFLN